jgi:O-antigen/teichoic acid export membrane protein
MTLPFLNKIRPAQGDGLASSSPERSLKSNFIWTFFGNSIYAGCQWAMLIVLAKFGSPEVVGIFALGLAVTGPVIMFTNLQLRGVQVTDAKREYSFGDYLGLRLLSLIVALVIFSGIAFGSNYSHTTAIVILLLGVTKAFDSLSDIIYGLLQQREQMKRVSISRMLLGTLQLTSLSATLIATRSIVAAVLALAAMSATVTIFYDIPSAILTIKSGGVTGPDKRSLHLLTPNWDKAVLTRLTLVSLPLGIVMLLISLNVNLPRYFIDYHLGTYQLGVFAALSSLTMIDAQVIAALGQAASPRLSLYYANGDIIAFKRLLLKLIGVSVVIGGLMFLLCLTKGREILIALFGSEYARYFPVFLWIMVGSWIYDVAQILGYGMTSARLFSAQTWLTAVVSLITLVTCAVSVKSLGLSGAAIASTVGIIVHGAGNALVLLKATRLKQDVIVR